MGRSSKAVLHLKQLCCLVVNYLHFRIFYVTVIAVLELPPFIDLGHMPVSNCFFQIAFVCSADFILVILTLQTVLSLAYSANLPKQFEGLYT